jgi:diacylglycerol O-acyltransferase / wax synthase
MKQLSGLDELFLALERNNQCMHVAALGIYDPSTAAGGHVRLRDILSHMRRRLDVAPVFRRRLVGVPFNIDRPYWVDESPVDLEYHVHHIALPDPGDWRQLCIQVARLHSQPLDRSKPLWQAYVIEGLNRVEGVPEGSFAIYIKFHHAAVDGDTSVQIMRAMHSMIAVPEHHAPRSHQVADAPPTSIELYARAAGNLLPRGIRAWRTGLAVGTKLAALVLESFFRRLTGREASLVDGFCGQIGWPASSGHSRFDGPVSSRRMVEGLSLPVRAIQRIRDGVEGATFDDVFLAIIGGAIRDYLAECGDRLPTAFAAGVPVADVDILPGGDSSNHVGLKRLPMHPEIANPRERLEAICRDRADSVQTADVLGRSLVRDLADQVPSSISSSLISAVLTDYASAFVATVRGPDNPMYLAGAQLKAFYPLGFVMDGVGLNVTGFRYRDELWVTIVSCRKMLPDPQKLARALSVNLAALAEAVEAGRERRPHPAAGASALSKGQAGAAGDTPAVASPAKRAAAARKRAPGLLPAGPGGEDSAIAIDPGVVVRAGDPATGRRRKSPAATQH